ncbi:MAG: ABC transporter substrate-binding protein [Candidatus Tectomicrobia bacterium]|uniref:ABC transporter substrate-binding protein n=1 Tax=Tectimicrobiota bacterium TaxID=2528274 RepID=A0A932M0U7_UNCTE|nr:ABC transporter substrate-binding protein [Candidatus Tectomicrobia bacterium]
MRFANRSRFWIPAGILMVALAVSPAPAAEKITVGMVGKNQAYLPVWVGQQKGFFKEKGMDVGYSVVPRLDVEAQALLAGSIQFSTSAAEGVIRLVEKGQDMKIIASLNNVPGFSLVARKEYKTLKDLKGTTLGVSGLKSGTTVLMQEILRTNGMEFPRDYKMVQVGSTQERMMALEAGNISAVMLMIPTNYVAIDKGYPEVSNLSQYVKEFQFTDINVGGKWAKENPGKVVDFLEGILKSNRWIHANRKEAVEIAAKETGVPVDYADRAYEYYIANKVQPLDGTVPERGVERVIESLGEMGDLKKPYPPATKFIDMSYLREAQKRVFGR